MRGSTFEKALRVSIVIKQHIQVGRSGVALIIVLLSGSGQIVAGRANALHFPRQQRTELGSAAQDERNLPALEPGKPIKKDLAGDQVHAYKLALISDQYLQVTANQQGIDIVVTVVGPDGKRLAEATSTGSSRGEPISLIAEISGSYRLEIRPLKKDAAGGYYEVRIEESRAATAVDRVRVANRTFKQGEQLRAQGTDEALRLAIEKYEEGLRIRRPVGDRRGDASTLNTIGVTFSDLGEKQKALDYFNQALAIGREINDRSGQAVSLTYLGVANSDLGRMKQALSYFNQALTLWRAVNNRQKVGDALIQIGAIYRDVGEKQKALDFFSQALVIKREQNDLIGQRAVLIDIGVVHLDIGNNDKALDYFNQATTSWRGNNDPRGEATTLNNIGVVCSNRGEKLVALDFFERALKLRQEIRDQAGEADTLHNIGVVYSDLDDKRQALSFFDRALTLMRAMGNRGGQANALNSLGFVYSALGDKRRALDYYQQSLPLRRAVGDRNGEAYTLNNIGAITASLGEKKQALEYFSQALALWRSVNDPGGQAKALTNLGVVNSDLEERQKALSFFDQALKLWRGLGNRTGDAYTLANVGFVYALQNEKQKALDHLSQALVLFREVKSLEGSGATLYYLMLAWKMFDNPDLAILYGKLAVGAYQEIRANIQGLDKELQQSFIKSKEDVYRELADLLLSEGRLPEAQQVIGLLKEEEYFEFIRGDKKEIISLPGRAALTPEEARLLEEYSKLAGRVTAIGVETSSLEAKPHLTPAEEQRLVQLEAERAVANQFFHKFLARLAGELEGKKGRITLAQISESQNLTEALKELGAGTVALYTLVTAKKYRVIIITPYSQKAAEYPIRAVDLNKKVLEFRQALQDPLGDPRPLGHELYRILVAPIAKDLADAGGQTLMWSLDGTLRYLPVAALYDGENYLVERYRNQIFTPASMINLKDQPQERWKGLGLGVSKAHAGFSELRAVREELRAVIRDEGDENATSGVLPGRVLLDEQFTEAAMRQALRQRYPLVHIASHFHFHPGNETDSSLLLGDGRYLTLARIKTAQNLFGGVDLLSLSACNTAMSGAGANGKEVEGFGVLAQRQGAKAVVATLWSVGDESTAALMKRFYQLRNIGAGMSKVEALRQAQLALLRGEELGTQTARRREPDVHLGPPSSVRKAPAVAPRDPQAPYAHPYYWAPFILIGNWK